MKTATKKVKTESAQNPDLGTREYRIALSRKVFELFSLWGLPIKDQLEFLGLPASSRAMLGRYREGEPFSKRHDRLDRAKNLISIGDSLHTLYPDNPEAANKWIVTHNADFEGQRPADIEHKEGFYGLLKIKRHLENKIWCSSLNARHIWKIRLQKEKTYNAAKVFRIKEGVKTVDFDSLIRRGFPFYMVRRAQRLMEIPDKDFASILGIGIGAFRRLKLKKGKLSRISSDQLYRLSALFAFAVDVLGSEEYARKWFASHLILFGGQTPLELAETDPGSREVESLLVGIRYGTCL